MRGFWFHTTVRLGAKAPGDMGTTFVHQLKLVAIEGRADFLLTSQLKEEADSLVTSQLKEGVDFLVTSQLEEGADFLVIPEWSISGLRVSSFGPARPMGGLFIFNPFGIGV